jgi:ubiquinone/menaquinone biosynthesis C-methylase UbiE
MSSPEPSSRRGEVFDAVAEAYDDVRRGYPGELVDEALAQGGLATGSRVVEVGCGTGKLTELLAARGLEVDAVDPGARMIEVARRRVHESSLVRFHHGRFEEVGLPEGAYDAVFSATAFHWIDPTVGWHKVARLLRPGGLLALMAHGNVADEGSAELESGFRTLWTTYLPQEKPWPPLLDTDALLAGARERSGNVSEVWDWFLHGRHALAVPEAADLFGAAAVTIQTETVEEDADHAIALLGTTSSYLRIDPERRGSFEDDVRSLYDRLGGTASFPLLTVLVTAARRG